MRSLPVLLAWFSLVLSAGVAQAQSAKGSAAHEAAKETSQEPRDGRGKDTQALREDLTRMKALVQQMQSNLAFVDTAQSPLKHQFQLEIDLWQTLITEMERRLAQPRQSAP
jgi:hypothetical protein